MASRSRAIEVLICTLAIGLGLTAKPQAILAVGPCSADYVVLGQMPRLTGPTPTDWFNVFGGDFDPAVPATLTFGVPVIPWSIDQPGEVLPAVTTFSMPAADMSTGFKWTFRARDAGVRAIRVRIAGKGCRASTLVDFSPPATSTADARPVPSEPSPVRPLLLLLAFSCGMVAVRRRLDNGARAGS